MDINEAFRPTVAGDLRGADSVRRSARSRRRRHARDRRAVIDTRAGGPVRYRLGVGRPRRRHQRRRGCSERCPHPACGGRPVRQLRGETTTGNTMIMLDQGGDSGDIVGQRVIPIGPEDTCASVYRDVGQAGADMLTAHLPALLAGNIGAGTYPNLGSFTNNRFGRNQRPDSAKQMSIPKAAVCTIAGNVFDDDGTPVPSAGSDPHAPQTRPIAAPCPRLRWGGFTSFYVPAIAASTTARNCSHCRAASPSARCLGGAATPYSGDGHHRLGPTAPGRPRLGACADRPGAFTMLRGHRVMVWATRLPGEDEPPGTPGELLDLELDGPLARPRPSTCCAR